MKLSFQHYPALFHLLSRRRKIQVFYLLLLSILSAVSETANIGLLIPFLGILADPHKKLHQLGLLGNILKYFPSNYLLPVIALFFILLIIISSCIRSFTIKNQIRLGSLINADLGKITFNSILNKPYEWHLQSKSHNIISLLTQDVERVGAIVKGILMLFVNSIIIGIVGGFLLLTSFQIMLSATLSLGIFYVILFQFFRKDFHHSGKNRMYNFQQSVKVLQESLGGIRDIILGRHYDLFIESYDSYNRKRLLNDAGILIKATIPRYLVEGFLIIIITLIALFYVILGNELNNLLPILAAVSLGAYKLMQPVQTCFTTLGILQSNQSALDKLLAFISGSSSFYNTSKKIANYKSNISDKIPLVRLKDVNFKYQNDEATTLQNINLCIYSGEFIAIVGLTGSGKSTLADLILGLLQPSQGNIFVDDIDIHLDESYLEDWHQRIAHVPQSIYLADTNIESNIAYGLSPHNVNQPRLLLAAQQASIEDFINSLPDGYQTVVGERGVLLSGGQRQRIGIARALYKQSELLILDEATSALDNYTEQLVMSSIKNLKSNITMCVIAHRLSTILHCDRIVVLDKGKISGIGRYNDLIDNNPIFRSLVLAKANDAS